MSDIQGIGRLSGTIGGVSQLSGDLGGTQKLNGEVSLAQHIMYRDYEVLDNLPKIEGVTLIGDKTYEELNLLRISNSELEDLLK